MPTIDLSADLPVAGTPADANQIANALNTIQALLNGMLDDTNIAAAAGLAISKLAGYPSDATKFLRGDGIWATIAAAAAALLLVDTSQPYKVQFGSSPGSSDSSGLFAVVFPTAFATACSTVIAVNGDTDALATGYGVKNSTVSRTGFSYLVATPSHSYRVNWLAIGY